MRPVDDRTFDADRARRELLAHFGVATLEAFGCEGLPRATAAAGAALRYVRETQKRDLAHVTGLTTRAAQDVLTIDAVTRRNLELVESLADGSRRGTLLDVLDHTRTAMGARLLREWILRPLVELERDPGPPRRRRGAGLPRRSSAGACARRSPRCRTSTGSSAA